MGEIVFIGLGLHSETGLSLRGLEEMKTSDHLFLEQYTSLMPGLSKENLERVSGKEISMVSRRNLEDEDGSLLLRAAERNKVALLVPGDPLIATTHVALRIAAEKAGTRTRIIHGASILSAAVGLSGLHNYKFGKSVTIPLPGEYEYDTPYDVIAGNVERGLHTLCLLDLNIEERRFTTIREGLELLIKVEERREEGIVTDSTLAVGVARAGSSDPVVKAGSSRRLLKIDFGEPPHTLIFPGQLHFMEAEALVVLADAPPTLLEIV